MSRDVFQRDAVAVDKVWASAADAPASKPFRVSNDVLARIFGAPFFCQPRRVPRLVFPAATNELSETAAHQDCPYVQGTLDTLTTWIPIGSVCREEGSLEVMEGSHRGGIRPIFGTG